MNLVLFLTITTLATVILGEFGQYPFGATFSVSLTDVFLSLTLIFFLIWKVGIKKELRLPLPFKFLIGFWLVGLLGLLVSFEFRGLPYLLRFIFYSLGFLVGYYLVSEKYLRIDLLFKVLVGLGVVLSLVGFIQLVFLPDLEVLSLLGYDPHKGRLVSSFLDPNFMGSFLGLVLVLSLCLSISNKWFLITTGIFLVAVVLTFSRSAYLMVISELFIFCLFKSRKYLVLMVLVFVLLYGFIPRFGERINGAISLDKSASERLVSYERAILVFKDKPLVGVGFNNIRYEFENRNLFKLNFSDGGNSGAGVDSSFLFVLVTTGIVGFLFYISFFGSIFKKIFKDKNVLALTVGVLLVGMFTNSQFINSLFYPPIMVSLYILLGAYYGTES